MNKEDIKQLESKIKHYKKEIKKTTDKIIRLEKITLSIDELGKKGTLNNLISTNLDNKFMLKKLEKELELYDYTN